MSTIRINELARELEVKPKQVIDLLAGFGVKEKKTHSSSLDADVAVLVRRALHGVPMSDFDDGPGLFDPPPVPERARAPQPERAPEPVIEKAPAEEAPAAPAPAPVATEFRPVQPLRPPVGSGSPIHPPLAAQAPVRAAVPPAPSPSAPAAPSQPAPPVPSGYGPALPPPIQRTAFPARPAPPAPRPGQILSGPRQPMPADAAPPVAPPPAPRGPLPGRPIAPAPRQFGPGAPPSSRPGAPPRQMPPNAVVSGGPRPEGPRFDTGRQEGGRPALAGQPAARPVVPPRADMVAKLSGPGRTMPGQPSAPRPGAPIRPQGPMPGQPIYQRPGGPMGQRSGPGFPSGPGGGGGGYNRSGPGGPMGRGRPMHPTSPLRPESAAPTPTDAGRRHATKPSTFRGRGPQQRDRDQEGKLYVRQRRDEPAAPPPIDREITIAEGITVKELAEKLNVKAGQVIQKMMAMGQIRTINQSLELKLAEEVSRAFGASTAQMTYEEETSWDIEMAEDSANLEVRPPVVTIMGHVDHGKTSLLDAIRETNVAGREAGGITQHIGAYHVVKDGKAIVFIDTPGHEAFTRMRARGAKVTDIVILVVAADDGVMPQTLEAMDHARAANVPIIVAINKVDKPDSNLDRVKQQLADRGLLADDWGGDTPMVPVSAKAKTNLNVLLEMILLTAELKTFKANSTRPAVGSVLEAKLDKGRGPVATVLIRNGTLRVGDHFICGAVFGRVRALYDDWGAQTREVGPSMPAEVIGLESLPEVGDGLQVITDTAKAKQIVVYREIKAREEAMKKGARGGLEQFHAMLKEGDTKELNIILKADFGGSAEVLSDSLERLSNERVRIRVLRSGIGAITESDVLLAVASSAIIIGFNVKPDKKATDVAEREKIEIRLHSIIYEMVDEMKKAMSGLLDPVFKEVYQGRVEVREVFTISRVGAVAGCSVVDGLISRNSEVRLLRDDKVIFTGRVDTLKRFKNDASEVKQGFECGITLAGYSDMKPGDVIEAFVKERVAAEAFV